MEKKIEARSQDTVAGYASDADIRQLHWYGTMTVKK